MNKMIKLRRSVYMNIIFMFITLVYINFRYDLFTRGKNNVSHDHHIHEVYVIPINASITEVKDQTPPCPLFFKENEVL